MNMNIYEKVSFALIVFMISASISVIVISLLEVAKSFGLTPGCSS